MLRRIERWLHQHVFKVGWLSTHNYQTTTILYYTFFMPGVILHEVVYYLMAGIVNVKAEHQIKWPDEQEIGELKLNFVKLAPRTSKFRKAIITSTPLLVGLICVWAISYYIFDITAVVDRMSSGELGDVGAGINLLLNAPLFWLWIYVIFTIANTMFPTVPKDLQGWRSVLIGLGVVAAALFLVGVGGELFEALQTPLSTIITVLSQTFVLIILIDLFMVLILGLIEYTIERITGHSATFRGNRMYTMTREEAIEQREQEREKERKRLEREQRRKESITAAPISIYSVAFVIPGAPGEEPITQLEPLPEVEDAPVEEPAEEEKQPSMPMFGGLANDGNERSKPLTEEQKQQRDAIAARINLPSRRPPVPETSATDEDEEVQTQQPAASLRKPMSMFSDGDAEATDEKPAASLTSRFGTQSRFGKSASDDSSEDDKPAATSRSGIRSPGETKPVDDTQDEKPAASLTSRFGSQSRFGKSTDDESDEIPATPSRFGVRSPVPSQSDDDKEDKPATTSRFGVRPPAQSDDDTQQDRPAASLTSRFGQKSAPEKDGEIEDKSAVSSRFGTQSRFGKSTDDETDKDEKPATPSRFGVRSPVPSQSDDDTQKDRPAASLTSRFGQKSAPEKDGEADGKPAVSSRFRTQSRFGKSTDDESAKDEKPATPSRFGVRSPGSTKSDGDTESTDEKPAASLTSRFGAQSRFGKSASDDSEDKDEKPGESRFGVRSFGAKPDTEKDLRPAPEDDETIRVVGRPASPGLLAEEDDDESLDEAIARRGRGEDDGISSLFGQLRGEDEDTDEDESVGSFLSPRPSGESRFGSRFGSLSRDEDSDDESIGSKSSSPFRRGTSPLSPTPSDDDTGDEDESVGTSSRFRSGSSFGSRFGTSRPAPKPTLSDEDDSDDDDDDESVSSLSSYRRSSPLTTRFGSSRPAPKPTSSTDDADEEDESIDDEIVYEDVEYYDDDEEYADYDDDDEYYDDED